MHYKKVYATCVTCGHRFTRQADEHWKIRCIPCFKAHKEAEYFSKHWRKPEPEQTRPSSAPDPIIGEFNDHLATLVRLCHPDKHQNSVAANEVTKWLLDKRKEARGKQQ